MDITTLIISAIAGFLLGGALVKILQMQQHKNAKNTAEAIVADAERNAKSIESEAKITAKERLQRERSQLQKQMKNRENEISKIEEKLRRQEKDYRRQENSLRDREQLLNKRQTQIEQMQAHVKEQEVEFEQLIDSQIAKLEEISGYNREDAKKSLKKKLMDNAKSEIQYIIKDLRDEAIDRSKWEAKEIMAYAIERMATDYTMESTLVSVSLPSDNYKGIIIGKGGQNIKAFEAATGVKVIVDDTPETVVMSSFDPVKREVARIAMEALIQKKNIGQKAIDQEVTKAQKQVDESIKQAADETLKELNIRNVHPDMKTYIGRLKYRTSYGQNILNHSKEVAWLAGNMAAELGLNVQLARRAGLFHDIGKAKSSESEGSHVTIGVDITSQFKEHPVVINAVLAHHEEAEPISPISVLVTAADRISGARPGARRESLEVYTERITKLETLAQDFEGVAKTYALSAGREIRVIVEPEKLTDMEAEQLAMDIAEKIKAEMEYPGQIKVTVIRKLHAQSNTENIISNTSTPQNGKSNGDGKSNSNKGNRNGKGHYHKKNR